MIAVSPTRYRSACLAATLLALGGCSGGGPSGAAPFANGAPSTEGRYAALSAGPAASRVILPAGAGRVVSVEERRASTGLRQDIALDRIDSGDTAAPSRNAVVVSLTTGRGSLFGAASVGLGRPSRAGIRADLRERFPDVAMEVVTQPVRNAYGPYGLATGARADGLHCLYAWQWIAAGHAGLPERDTEVSLRVALCRRGAGAGGLKAMIDDLRIAPAGVAARPVPEALAQHPRLDAGTEGRRLAGRGVRMRGPAAGPVAAPASAPAARLSAPKFSSPRLPASTAIAGILDPDIPARAYRGPEFPGQRPVAPSATPSAATPSAAAHVPDAGALSGDTTTETSL